MWQRSKILLSDYGPAVTLGLFGGRVISEWAPFQTNPGFVGVLLMTLASIAGAIFALRLTKISSHWPLYGLLFYVAYPEPNPTTAVLTLLFTLTMYAWTWRRTLPLVLSVLLTAVPFAVLYIATQAPDILPADNGEFQLVAANLGVAHPPGFALYTILAHLMTKLPLASAPAYKINLFAAITSVLSLIIVHLTVYRLTKQHKAGATAVLALGTATTFWAQATTANIRSLTGLFAAIMIYALVQFREINQNKPLTQSAKDKWLAVFALTLGLGVTHHASLAFMGLIFLLFIAIVDPLLLRTPRRWIQPFLFGLLGLLPLLYFPLRAGADVRGAEAGLATAAGFFNHILALGFRGDLFYFITPADLWARFQVMGNVLTFQFSPWLLGGMGIGFAIMLWRDRKLVLLLGGSFVLHTFITATYRAPQTVEYMLPAYLPLAIGLGYGVGKAFMWRDGAAARWRSGAAAVFGAVMLVTAVYQGWQRYPSFAWLHQDTSTRDYTQVILDQAPDNAVILADWHWATPLWYLQEVEGQRHDVAVQFVFPEGESYAANWTQRIGDELADGRSVIATHFDENAYASLPAPEPFGEAYLFRQQPRTAVPDNFAALDSNLNAQIHLLGYQLHPQSIEIGQEAILTIAWQPISSLQSPVPLFAHLVAYDGRLYAQDDLQAQPQPDGITLTQFRLTPRLGAVPGDFAIMIGIAGDGNGNGDSRTSITTLPVAAMSQPPITQNPVYRTIPSGRPLLRLIGYDWDNTLDGRPRLYLHWQTEQGYQTEVRDDFPPMPDYFGPWGLLTQNSSFTIHNSQFYVPLGQGIVWMGEPFRIPQSPSIIQPAVLRSSRPILRDLVISTRLIGFEEDGFHWDWSDLDDSIPATGAIPTLKWIAGSTVRSPHYLTVDPAAQPGQTIGATLRIYDAFTNRPLPILDERIVNELQLPWIPLGTATLPSNLPNATQ